MADEAHFSIEFIQGPYKGSWFPLYPHRNLEIGRGLDLDLVLEDNLVSRQHACLKLDDSQVSICDMGSTNGTIVNGEHKQEAILEMGDTVLIGSTIFRLSPMPQNGEQISEDEARILMEGAASRNKRQQSSMTGDLAQVPLPDLIQLLCTIKAEGVLRLALPGGHEGRLFFDRGALTYCMLDGKSQWPPMKALVRLLAFEEGTFELGEDEGQSFDDPFKSSTEGLLMEGMRQMDELARIADKQSGFFELACPMEPSLRDLDPSLQDILQLVHNYNEVQAVLDNSPLSDLDTHLALQQLAKQGYISSQQ